MKNLWFVWLCYSFSAHLVANELDMRGQFGVEGIAYTENSNDPRVQSTDLSLSAQPEFYYEPFDFHTIAFSPFLRLQQHDDERSHFDIRELYWEIASDDWIAKLGFGQVFWGTTEFVHLVNIVNQIDLVENLYGEDRLGQPMLEFSYYLGDGQLDLYVLPGFRERTFPGVKGRLRTPWPVDTDNANYESGAEEHHVDFAMRYATVLGNLDFGLSAFHGTDREPIFRANPASQTLSPYYRQMSRLGLDGVYVWEDWLFKLEAVMDHKDSKWSEASTGGFEYTFIGLAESDHDLGIIVEYSYHSLGDEASPFAHDLILGTRYAFNDEPDTQFLLGYIQDLKQPSQFMSLEASRRLTESMKLNIESFFFLNADNDDPFIAFERDDFIKCELVYYY